MGDFVRIPFQILAYAAFALFVGYFATMPHYQYGNPDVANIKVSLSHATDRVVPCVELTPEQIAELAANMRQTEACVRERLPLLLEFDLDGERVFNIKAEPSGVWNDGPASIYERFEVTPGTHQVTVRMRDTARTDGWDYTRSAEVVLEPGRYFTVTFKAATGGFNFR